MSRNNGLIPISANFETRIAAPLDARLVANTINDLTNESYWLSGDSNTYLYNGIAVAVWNDGDNNGVYILTDESNYQDINSWLKIGSPEYGSGLTFSDNTISISLTQSSGLTFSTSGELVSNVDNNTIGVSNGELKVLGNSVYQYITASTTTGNYQSTGITIGHTPLNHSSVKVFINGQIILLGDKTADCYFSNDGGVTAKSYSEITSGDELYFNGQIVGWDLSNQTDRIILIYEANV